MKVRKSQDGRRVLDGELRAISCPQTDKCPPHTQTAQDGLSRDSKNLQRDSKPHTGSPCPETWSVCLGKRHTLPGVQAGGEREYRWGQKPGDGKRRGTFVGNGGDWKNSSEDEHAGYEIRKQLL